jgi:hypothetical protein
MDPASAGYTITPIHNGFGFSVLPHFTRAFNLRFGKNQLNTVNQAPKINSIY